MFESAFGTDFGLTDYPGYQESTIFRVLSIAPSGLYFNYVDCYDKRNKVGELTLACFAAKTGNESLFEKDRSLMPANEMGRLPRLAGEGLIWLSRLMYNYKFC